MSEFKPTYLYIKEHSITKLKYFGKTIKNPHKYIGSGKYWLRHCKKHGKQYVITLWISEPYTDIIKLKTDALYLSKSFGVGQDKINWANLIPENGINGGGDCSQMLTKEVREKAKNTSMTKYGVTLAMLAPENKKKSKNSRISKYGSLGAVFSQYESINKRNETNFLLYGNKCAANKDGNIQSKITQKALRDRPIAKTLAKLKRYKKAALPKGWQYKDDIWIENKITEFKILPYYYHSNPDITKYTNKQLTRHKLLNRDIVKHLMRLRNEYNLKLDKNWFQKSDEWIENKINLILKSLPQSNMSRSNIVLEV
jgi:hypothetical protein